jgi:hypothetical protein
MVIALTADGKWSHTASGIIDKSGTWSYVGKELSIDGSTIERMDNCMALTYEGRTYHRDDVPSGCPDTVPSLTAAEKCLVGEFKRQTSQNTASTAFTWTRTSNRLQVWEQVYTGNGDDAHYTAVSFWQITGGKLCTDRDGCLDINWGQIESDRTTPKESGCVIPVDTATQYCGDAPGYSSAGIGCTRENRNGATKWELACDDDTSSCTCKKAGATLWSGRSGDSSSCSGNDVLWNACCGL